MELKIPNTDLTDDEIIDSVITLLNIKIPEHILSQCRDAKEKELVVLAYSYGIRTEQKIVIKHMKPIQEKLNKIAERLEKLG